MIRRMLLAVFLATLASAPAMADTIISTKAVTDIGKIGADTKDILTANVFTFGLPVAAIGGDGDFDTYASGLYYLTASTLDLSNITTFSIGSADFGSFTAKSIVVDAIGAKSKSFLITGNFTPGTDFPSEIQIPQPARLALGFTQVKGPKTTISVSGTLTYERAEFDPNVVPEPSTLAMGAFPALMAIGAIVRRRRA